PFDVLLQELLYGDPVQFDNYVRKAALQLGGLVWERYQASVTWAASFWPGRYGLAFTDGQQTVIGLPARKLSPVVERLLSIWAGGASVPESPRVKVILGFALLSALVTLVALVPLYGIVVARDEARMDRGMVDLAAVMDP